MMPGWMNLVLPLAMSIASAFVTASFMTGKSIEKVTLMDEKIKEAEFQVLNLLERVARLEGLNSAKRSS